MTRKPRKRRFEDMLNKEGYFVLDGGNFPGDAPPAEDLPAPVGRPLDSTSLNYEDIDPFLDFLILHPKRLTQRAVFDLLRYVYAQKYNYPPSERALKARLADLKSQPE
jgi:hypothetical protein